MGSCCSPDLPAQLLAPRVLPVTPVIRGRVSNHMLEKCRSAFLLSCLDWYWGEGLLGVWACWWSLSNSCHTPASPSTADTGIGNLHLTLSDVSKQSSQGGVLAQPRTTTHFFLLFPSDTRSLSVHSREEAPQMGRMGKLLVKLETLKLLIRWRNS